MEQNRTKKRARWSVGSCLERTEKQRDRRVPSGSGTTAQNLRTFPKSSVAWFGRKQKIWRAFLILFWSHCLRLKIASPISLDLISFCRLRPCDISLLPIVTDCYRGGRTRAPEEYSSPEAVARPRNCIPSVRSQSSPAGSGSTGRARVVPNGSLRADELALFNEPRCKTAT